MPQVVRACQNQVYNLLRVLPDVPVLVLGEWAQRSLGLSVAERWERTKLSGGKWSLGAKHPAAAIYEPTLMFQIAQAIKKFSLASTPDDVYYQYPGKMVYVENPYPLPDLNRWGGQLICVDIETDNGVSWRDPDNHIFLLGIGVGSEFYILTREYLNQPETHAWLRALFVQHGHNIGGHNFKFDLLKLAQEFGVPLVIGWDTILMVNVYHESWHKGLKELATWFYNADDYEERLVKNYLRTKYKKPTDRSYADVPQADITEYLLNDIIYNLWLATDLENLLRETGQWDMPYHQHEIPQANLLAQVEWQGFPVSLQQAKVEADVLAHDSELIVEQITRLSGGTITKPGSLKQIREYLYNVAHRPIIHYTKGGQPSTDEEVLLANNDLPTIAALLFWRRVSHLKNNYLDNLPDLVFSDNQEVNRAHSNYKAFNVVTHRLSAVKPAVQTIPNKDSKKDTIPPIVLEGINELHGDVEFTGDYGIRIKRCFVARPGYVLLTMDGSGWELATAALQSQDKVLVAAFQEGVSPHNKICEMLYGTAYTKAQKVKEKNVVFGWMYLGKVQALASETGLPLRDVQEVVDWLEANLVGIKQWRARMVANAMTGYNVVPFFNYINHFDLITAQGKHDVEKHAVNYVNQGLGWMIISKAAYTVYPYLAQFDTHIVALVHDDFTVEVPVKHIVPVATLMLDTLVTVGQEITDVIPLSGELKIGFNWGDMNTVTVPELQEQVPAWLTKGRQ